MTGQQFGYRYYDNETGRAPAVGRWHDWLSGRQALASTPEARAAEQDE
jgi:hypothetical protein